MAKIPVGINGHHTNFEVTTREKRMIKAQPIAKMASMMPVLAKGFSPIEPPQARYIPGPVVTIRLPGMISPKSRQ